MIAWREHITVLFIAVMQSLALTATHSAKSTEVGAASPGTAERTVDPTATMSPNPHIAEPKVISNPLWAISIDQLSTTRQRPLFSPTRRPPPVPVVAPVAAAPILVTPPPERLQFTLVGTIVGEQGGIGVFVEQSTQKVFRLKIGEAYAGWILRSIRRRSVDLEKDGRLVVVEMTPIAPIQPQPSNSSTRAPMRAGG